MPAATLAAMSTSPPAAPSALSARALTKTYGRGEAAVTALRGVDVDIARGAFTAVMGPSGSGKSTLLHCLAGLDTVTSGSVWLGETELTSLSDQELTLLRRKRIGFVFQAFNLLPMLTAEQNVLLPLDLAGRRSTRADGSDPRTDGTLAHLSETLGIADRMTHRPGELSGGQQQRVAIARALVTRPDVVVADEPTGNLDSHAGAEVLALLRRRVTEFGETVVMVTHDPVAASYADRVLLMADGVVAGELLSPTAEQVLAATSGAVVGASR